MGKQQHREHTLRSGEQTPHRRRPADAGASGWAVTEDQLQQIQATFQHSAGDWEIAGPAGTYPIQGTASRND